MLKFVGDKPLDSIGIQHIAEYSDELNRREYKSNYTWNKFVKTLRVFFNFCVSEGLIEKSPASVMKMRREPRAISKDKAMSDKDLAKLLTYTQFHPKANALVLFLADTGCRARGVSQLQVSEIDFQKREAVVTEKGEKTRTVRFGPVCATALAVWIAERPADYGDYVFSGDRERRGKPMLSSSVSQIVRRACERAGIKPRGAHSLRHRKGHQLADAKVAPSLSAQVLGHSDPAITLQHYYPDDWDRVSQAFDELAVQADEVDEKIIPYPQQKTT